MADISLTGVAWDGDDLVLTGTGFTKTTTTVFVGSNAVAFEAVSDTEIRVDAVDATPGQLVSADKAGITTDRKRIPAKDEADASTPEGHTADTSTTAEGDDEMTDATASEMNAGAANATIETPQNPKTEVTPEKRGEHVPYANFREAVHQSPVTRVEEDLGIGVRDPYPTGNPRPQEDIDAEVGRGIKREDDDHGRP